jgi:hypothetical protein
MGRSSQYSRRYVTLSTIANTLGAWTFRVPNEKSSEFFLHVILLLIGESLTEALTTGLIPPGP